MKFELYEMNQFLSLIENNFQLAYSFTFPTVKFVNNIEYECIFLCTSLYYGNFEIKYRKIYIYNSLLLKTQI